MRKNIIQSKTEPNKNDIWLSEEGLKKYGKNGWEPLGGGSNNSGGYTDMMVLNTRDNATLTEEQFNEIEERVKNGCLFELQYYEPDGILTYYSQGIKHDLDSTVTCYVFNTNFSIANKDVSFAGDVVFVAIKTPTECGFTSMLVNNLSELDLPVLRTPKFYYTGNGTKFLSDDGTYKEVSGGNGPVIIEYPNVSNEEIAVTDEQIEAVKNGNVKIKLTMTGTTNYIISAPISIAIMEEVAEIVVRSYFGENITDAILLVDFTNKTISISA